MPRTARKMSGSNIYHIVLRGINKQIIFEQDADYLYFVDSLKCYKDIFGYTVFAYCIMDNHVHLLMKFDEEDVSDIMKRISCKYVYWYNRKYKRTGHLFQERFHSEPVEDERYFKTVFRYIMQNPVKAGIVKDMKNYRWCNYRSIFGKNDDLTDAAWFTELFLDKEDCLQYLQTPAEEVCIDIKQAQDFQVSDEDALDLIRKMTGCRNVADFQNFSKRERNNYLFQLKKSGMSIRQISRLTGVSKSVVGRA